MDIIAATLGSAIFIGAASLAGKWFKSGGEQRKRMVWPLRIVGAASCLVGSLLLLSDLKPGTTSAQFGLVMGTALVMILAGMLDVGLAGYTMAD